MTLEELIAHIESRFECVEGLPCARCQTGDEYRVIGNPWSEGEPGVVDRHTPHIHRLTTEEAVAAALDAFNAYAADKNGKLYWRHKDKAEIGPIGHKKLFRVYMRLAISDAPEIYPTLADYNAERTFDRRYAVAS